MSKKRELKVHLAYASGQPYCGNNIGTAPSTADPSIITCGNCIKNYNAEQSRLDVLRVAMEKPCYVQKKESIFKRFIKLFK